jgi:hypothetical protein
MGVGGLLYLVLALRGVRNEADAQESLLQQEGLRIASA